jgi:dimethylglycine catabolism A
VIGDEDHGTFVYAAAEMLLRRFQRVVIVTPRATIAADEPLVLRQGIYQRISGAGIALHTLSQPHVDERFDEAVLGVRHVLTGKLDAIDDVALITYATSRQPNDQRVEPLPAAGIRVERVVDSRCCSAIRHMCSRFDGVAARNRWIPARRLARFRACP